jgi:hypothetical protein
MSEKWRVQIGKGKGSYSDKYVFDSLITARIWYSGINTHSGYKKRLIDPNGKVVHRNIT